MTKPLRSSLFFLALLTLWAGSPSRAGSAGQVRVHPDNPWLLTNDSGRPIVLTGSHTWSIFQDLQHDGRTRSPRYGSFGDWLSLLGQWNHNFTRGWIWEDGFYSPGLFRQMSGRPDLGQPNPELLRRLASRIGKAERQGLYVSVLLFQGWSVTTKDTDNGPRREPDPWPRHPFSTGGNRNGIAADRNGDGRGHEVHHADGRLLDFQKRYVASIVDALRRYDNVIWEIANEAHADSLAWQIEMTRFVREVDRQARTPRPVWMSCLADGGASENAALFSSPADIVSPCHAADAPYLDDPPVPSNGKIVIADSDHIVPGRVRIDWVWRSLLRGLHPIYMDLAADDLPWYLGPELDQDPRIADQMRRTLGAVQRLAESLPLATMAPQRQKLERPVRRADDGPAFALFTTREPSASTPPFDGSELLALEPEGGGTLEICGLVPGSRYRARWVRTLDLSLYARATTHRVEPAGRDPRTGAPSSPETDDTAAEPTSGATPTEACLGLTNPDPNRGKLLHLRRVAGRPSEAARAATPAGGTVQ